MQVWIQRAFRPVKQILPRPMANLIRSTATAVFGPYYNSYRSGHFLSAFRMRAVDRRGAPVPWYAYPCVDLLKTRSFKGRRVLELGAGQSTLWWAGVAESVLAFEDNAEWHRTLLPILPPNAEVRLIEWQAADECCAKVDAELADYPDGSFDVIVVDGMSRAAHLASLVRLLGEEGALILDNSSGYGFYEHARELGLQRVDFSGMAPGVVLPQCTSVLFRTRCFLFDSAAPVVNLVVD